MFHCGITEVFAMIEFLQQLRDSQHIFVSFCGLGPALLQTGSWGWCRCLWTFSPGAGSSADPLWGRIRARELVGHKLGKRFMRFSRSGTWAPMASLCSLRTWELQPAPSARPVSS